MYNDRLLVGLMIAVVVLGLVVAISGAKIADQVERIANAVAL